MKKKMIAMLMAVLMLSALFTVGASAADAPQQIVGTELYWQFEATTGVLTITGTGAMPDYDTTDNLAPWDLNKTDIKSVVLPEGLTKIGSYAFAGTDIDAVTIPSTVLTIGDSAFAGTQITAVEIPNNVTSLGKNVFPAALATVTAPCTLAEAIKAEYTSATVTVKHTLTEHAATVTATTAGTIQYWECTATGCGKLFSDSEGTVPTTLDAVTRDRLDNEAPKHTEIILGSNTASQPADATAAKTEVSVKVIATDLPETAGYSSGIASGKITLSHTSNKYAPDITCALTVNEYGTSLTGSLPILYTTPSGTYYVSKLVITDKLDQTYTAKEEKTTLTITRDSTKKITPVTPTLTFNATSVGYGGTVKGTIKFMDGYNNPIANKTFKIYVGTSLYTTTGTTDENGEVTFTYTNATSGSYVLKATFDADTDYTGCETNAVTITFTTVPATGDSYDIGLWICVAAVAIGINAWFIFRKRRA